jgi:GDP-4-dehydro-6-deoxy-D-mannose reductase
VSHRVRSVLITGAQGFLGRHLTHHWLTSDPAVRIVGLGRSPQRRDTFPHCVSWRGQEVVAPVPRALRADHDSERYVYRRVDLAETAAVAALLRGERIDTIVHLAASLRDAPFDLLVRNNVVAVQSLFEAAVEARRPELRIVVGSSGSIHGPVAERDLPISEDAPAAPLDLYAVTKHAGEQIASVYRRRHGLDTVVARIFNVIGPGEDERHLAPYLARQFAERCLPRSATPIGVGPLDTTRDFVDVRDVAAALVTIATAAGRDQVINVASGVECLTQTLFDTLADLAGRPDLTIDRRPARPVDFRRQRADVSRLSALGFKPGHALRDSLEALLRYYLDEVASAAIGAELRR